MFLFYYQSCGSSRIKITLTQYIRHFFNFKSVAVTSVWWKDEKIESFSSFFLKLKDILKMMTPRVKKYLSYFQFLTSFISSYPASVIKKKKKKQQQQKPLSCLSSGQALDRSSFSCNVLFTLESILVLYIISLIFFYKNGVSFSWTYCRRFKLINHRRIWKITIIWSYFIYKMLIQSWTEIALIQHCHLLFQMCNYTDQVKDQHMLKP